MKFIDIIKNLSSINEALAIYIPKHSECELEDQCLLMNYDDEDKKYSEYKYFLGVYDIVDIIYNLSQQNPAYNMNDVIKAIKFYYEYDAFISLHDKI